MQRDSQLGKAAHRYFRRVHDSAPVEFCVEACLPAQSRYSDCRRCEASCPTGALKIGESGIQVSGSCVGCGQCAAACPTDALGVPGFALPPVAQDQTAPVFVDCWQVPFADSPAGAVHVPCLGGISLSRMIGLCVAAGTRQVVLLDRGWCAACAAAAGRARPAAACTEAARELLQAVRIPVAQWPVIQLRLLHRVPPVSAKPDRNTGQRLSRRAFFGDLAARATNAASAISPLTSGKQPPAASGHQRKPERSRARERLLAHMKSLSESTGSAMPSSLYPALNINPQKCLHDQLCAVTCPTGALVSFTKAGVSGLVFDASGCIACGHCEAICPEQALELQAEGDGQLPASPKVLIQVRQSECHGCGRPFHGTAGRMLCPSCDKRSQVAAAAFQALFGRPT